MKKLLELKSMFQYEKEILGWMFNGKNFTITLPKKKETKILEQLKELLQHKTSTLKPLEKIQGKLIHTSLGLPGGRSLLSPVYKAVAMKQEKLTQETSDSVSGTG